MPAQASISGRMFIAPYKAITRCFAFAQHDKAIGYQSTYNSLMLPRLLRRGYDCIFQGMTSVNRYLAKAFFELTFRNLHLKVEAIKKNMPVCVHPQTDISGRHTGLPLRSNETRCFAFVQHDKAIGYQLTPKNYNKYSNLLTHKLTFYENSFDTGYYDISLIYSN
ncbi:hypothetical protein D0T66_05300 [Dysgonomonas sp. 25]|nr:hypothetical protein [Dysgonomonas sp. 25]